MDANKCNITNYSISKINELNWGMKAAVNINDAILENYLQYLNCSTNISKVCYPDSCTNNTIVWTCSLGINKLTLVVDTNNNSLKVYIDPNDITNGKSPYTYLWSFDEQDLLLTSGINSSEIDFLVKEGKSLNSIVAEISVELIDSNNCKYNKSCFLINGSLACTNNYVACRTTSNLIVTNVITSAVPPSGLIVTLI